MLLNDGTATVLLGAEGCSETEGQPWLREATETEIAAMKEKLAAQDCDYSEACVDGNNRPYWQKTVDLEHPECPEEAKRKAKEYDRVLRLVG